MKRYPRAYVWFAAAFWLLFSMSSPLLSQIAGTGAISGTVKDPSGAVIPGASIRARNVATGEVRQAVSSSRGEYTVQLLEPGRYEVIANKGDSGRSR